MAYDYNHPLWSLVDLDNDKLLEKSCVFTNEDAITDFLQHNAVFINGITYGRNNQKVTCHCDSYGTIVDFEALSKAIAELDKVYQPTAEDWRYFTDHCLGSPNMQPPLRLVALTLCRKYNIPEKQVEMEQWR